VFLISGGESSSFSWFVDASSNGNDVFFDTRQQLTPEDRVGKFELYDARVDGGFPHPSLACTGTGCQGIPPSSPQFATPASATFGGGGNPLPTSPGSVHKTQTRAQKLAKALKSCRRKRIRRRRRSCEAHAHRLYGPKPLAKKATKGKALNQ
jgi:hypothetical protein